MATARRHSVNRMTDMTNQAIDWLGYQKSLTPDKPFFIYFAPGATHAPHHVPKEWIAKYKGQFDQGWDKLREETLARQIKLGVVPAGTMNGLFNEGTYFNGVPETVEEILKHIDELGGPNSYGHYAAGWAVAGDTPFTWTKQVAGSYGGCRNGMAVHWPKGIKAKNEVRSQWHHLIDVAPTILEAA